jgi:hypothetical protein
VALAVDQWNGDRLDRVQEREIVDLLISDLQGDRESLSGGRDVISRKSTSLEKLYSGLERTADQACLVTIGGAEDRGPR